MGVKLRKRLWLAASLPVALALLAGGCAQPAPAPSPQPAPVSEVIPAEHPTDFPENLRWLTDEEKARAIEMALNTPKAQEFLEKESEYATRLSWAALFPSSTGEGYSGYQIFEYEIVAEGIPRGVIDITPERSPEKIVSVGVPDDAEIYPNVTLRFGEPAEWQISVAVDLKANKVVFNEGYPAGKGIKITPPPEGGK